MKYVVSRNMVTAYEVIVEANSPDEALEKSVPLFEADNIRPREFGYCSVSDAETGECFSLITEEV